MSTKIGILSAMGACIIYGLYPPYFKQLQAVSPMQIVNHRVVWTFVLLVPLFLWKVEWKSFRETAFKPKTLVTYFISGWSLWATWYLFLWGVHHSYVIEISLGFFMNPVFSVVTGVIVLKEKLRFWQRIAVALAVIGVLVVAIAYGKFPWLGLSISTVMTIYSFVKKTAPLKFLEGVTLEVGFVFLPALIVLVASEINGNGSFGHVSGKIDAVLVCCGVITVVPVLMFAYGAPMLSLTILGLVQYTTPIMTFLFGVIVYHESFSTVKLIGFIMVWLALFVFIVEGFWNEKRAAPVSLEESTSAAIDLEKMSLPPGTPTAGFVPVEDEAV
ncbi:hypothetical protein AC1031_003226 [Aphanomyces cochlioides]|nr:hypothetical protein AC1031_003226 [Aphanomyces cochlioides]